MAQLTWEKPTQPEKANGTPRGNWERYKFLAGGGVLLAIVAILVLSGTLAGARYFLSVDTVVNDANYVGQNVRLTGAVLGDSIQYDPDTGDLSFTIAHVPDQFDDLAVALHESVSDPTRTRVTIVMKDQVMPDLLQHEAQAILTGKMGEDGSFYATELNLKCPSRFGQGMPDLNHPVVETN
jgi:cytochrome c-type biogenesis protein CcmE